MAGLLDKCYSYNVPDEVKRMGLYPYFRPIESKQSTEVIMNGRRVLMLGSNSYMGLTDDPRIIEAVKKAVETYGSGTAGSRFLNGTLSIHLELEQKLADFMSKEACLLFSTGFQANLGVISALVGRSDYVITDRLDHASIIDGCRLAFGKMVKFMHNDMEDLERCLKSLPMDAGKLIVVDGVFSMDGDIAKLPGIVTLARKYNSEVMSDDAHSIGVLGKTGNGTPSHFDLEEDVALVMGTFSKSLASVGGFVVGDREIIEYLKHNSRPLIFSASPPPTTVAAVSTALDIIKEEPERREKLWYNTHKMLNGFREMGYNTGLSETPIIPLLIGDMMKTFKMCKRLEEEGVFINPVVPPAVPPNESLIRVSFMATHSDAQLDFALDKFKKVGKELGIL
ncbi:aminotransferase class I/II-fold pyridoxal phosphate-dependent enzyme [bacterium]|nr:aminotransferase class I/II-fold pyridoxal phosphate-dependent enzyme [bacterium]